MINLNRTISTLFLIVLALAARADNSGAVKRQKLAPGYGDLRFTLPQPGTYSLPALGFAADGKVLDSQGRLTSLHALLSKPEDSKKIVLLSFIYSTCSDVNGCPLATAVMQKLEKRLEQEPSIASQIRFITLSFNPAYDTPARMNAFGSSLQSKKLEWLFLTTRSEQDIEPILKGYGQTIEKVYNAQGHFTNTYNHGLRVFLIDSQKQIRNIYNTELLHADVVLSDIKTLLKSEAVFAEPQLKIGAASSLAGAGDDKSNYESKDYRTDSRALIRRKGLSADLLKTVKQPPLGLPPVPVPKDNPMTAEKISLGRKLFYDRRLSINNTFSCAMCHIPEQGFTSNEMATAVGVEGRTVRRNSPTIYNVAYMQTLFHDSRESTLEQQVWGPFLAHNEMANPSIGYVIDKIKNSQDYRGLFESAFGKPPGMETIGMAIASYQRTLNSANSPFDRWYFGKDPKAVDAKAKQGFALFTGKAGCSQCHTVGKDYALFTDNALHNTGIGYADAMTGKTADNARRVQVAPGVYANVPNAVIATVSETKANDLGRYEITQNPQDRWKYKTPSLRNIALSAPYMHNGSLTDLKDVIGFYNRGGVPNENLDLLIKPLKLSTAEMTALAAFLGTLTGDNVEELVGDAFAAPVGDNQ